MNTELERAKTLSLLDPKPVLVLEQKTGNWLAYWNGICMTAGHAMELAFAQLLGLHSSTEVHRKCDHTMLEIYRTGVLGNQWDEIMSFVEREHKQLIQLYRYYLKKHIQEHLHGKFTALEIFKWFDNYTVANY